MVKYFFDTYALIELVKNSSSYVKILDEVVVTTKFNLVELYFLVLEDFGEEKAKQIYNKFKDCVVDVPDDALFRAMAFRLKNKKKNLSYVDCIGYAFSLMNDLKFLTGDEAFRDLPGVEFIK